MPRLKLGDPRGLHPHVGYCGTVCVNDGQGLSLDLDRFEDIVAHTVLAGFDLLEKWAKEAKSDVEFFNELEGYWSGLPDIVIGRAAVEVDGNDRLVTGYENRSANFAQWFFTEKKVRPPFEFHINKLETKRALYIHLDGPLIPPVFPDRLTSAFVQLVRSKLSSSQAELWSKLVGPSKNGVKKLALLISIPREAGGRSLIGVIFTAKNGVIDDQSTVYPLTLRRHSSSYMRERGGAPLELLNKHIAVLGCGAVGSVVADTLASAGIGTLTLVDNDNYTEDNVFRHVLDPIYIDLSKPEALKDQLERKYPGIKIIPECKMAEKWLETAKIKELDGIVIAIGSPTVERSISRDLKSNEYQLPIIFTWLEALDLGGHSILVWGDAEGCLDCLYRDDEGAASLYPQTSFLEPNQNITRNLTGCASIFVPFGALQARKTGLMAAEHILTAIGREHKPSYRFWTGDGVAASKEGLRTTQWWNLSKSTSQEEASRRIFSHPCKRCKR